MIGDPSEDLMRGPIGGRRETPLVSVWPEAQTSAEALARRAVSLDGADAEARSCVGWALQARGELDGALVEIERALAMSPNLAVAHWQLGATLIFSGQPIKGLDALETCIRLDPRNPFMAVRLLHIACDLYFAREYERVIAAANRLIRSYPDFPMILPLARRRSWAAGPRGRSEGVAGQGGFACTRGVQDVRAQPRPVVSARGPRPLGRGLAQSRLAGGLLRAFGT